MIPVRYPRTTAWAAAAVLVLVPATAGCGDNGAPDSPTSPTPTATAPATPTKSPPVTERPTDPAAAKAEIQRNWAAFFDPRASTKEKVQVLQNGEEMRPLVEVLDGVEEAARSSAKVTKVQFTSATEATVTYDLLVRGTRVLNDTKGIAVLQDGTWKVSVKTLCTVAELSGIENAPGC